jgi:MFS family permease
LSSPAGSAAVAPEVVAGGPVTRWTKRTFSSLGLRNYRLYFIGQFISLSGTWMQIVATSLLVLKLTGSMVSLGLVTSLQFLPVALLAPYGGLVADRFSKRKILFFTQTAAAVLAFVLGTLVATGLIQLWMLYALALLLGLVNAIDNPVRQSFVHEMVGPETLRNAVTLNSLEVNLCRVIGPAIAGAIIAVIGFALCYFINGISFMGVLACLYLMKGADLQRSAPIKRAGGQLREGFAYVWHNKLIFDVLVMMTVVGMLTYEFQVTLPSLARFVFHDPIVGAALLTSATGVGAVIGGLYTASRRRATLGGLTLASMCFGISTIAVSVAPTMAFALAGMVVVGMFSIAFTSLTNTILQMEAEPTMRGRVMSLWTVGFLGSTVIGAPVIGWIGQVAGPRWSIAAGGVAALIAAVIGLSAIRLRGHLHAAPDAPEPPSMTEKEDRQ